MKATTLIVLGGLLFAGTVIAAEPQQATSSESGSKVGIDAKTGKLRRLTAAESAQLDAMAAKSQAPAAKAKAKTANKEGLVVFTAVNGMTVTEHNEAFLVDAQATIGADGKVVVTHDGETMPNAVEAANE